MYFEIYRNGNLIKRSDEILGALSWSNELMYEPSMTITLPIYFHEYFTSREEVKIFVNDKCFWGITDGVTENKNEETIEVTLKHIIHEWTFRQISVNNAIKDKNINFVFVGDKKNSNGNVTITANNFEVFKNESMTSDMYVSRARASAWTASGETLTVSVDSSDVKLDESGTYKVTFTASGVSVTVDCKVKRKQKNSKPIEVSKNLTQTVVDNIGDIYADTNFAYEGWEIDYQDGAGEYGIDYVYSRQNKLEALNKTLELTKDLYWRVGFTDDKVIEIGKFGEMKEWIISTKPTGIRNISIIEEPTITHSFSNVVNLATVYSEKSDSGMSSMTLREVYNDPSLQEEGFPVVILRANVNNERDYTRYSTQYPKLASNNELEFAVIDEESVALEGGRLIEGTYSFNDLSPFSAEADGKTKKITDSDRIKAAKTAYHAVIKKLKQARRSFKLQLTVEELPVDINVGDRVRLLYSNTLYMLEECTSYLETILTYDDWFYITAIDYNIEYGVETNTITLEKYLKIDRETSNT